MNSVVGSEGPYFTVYNVVVSSHSPLMLRLP